MLAQKKRAYTKILAIFAAIILLAFAIAAHYFLDPWGFYWKVSAEETALRNT